MSEIDIEAIVAVFERSQKVRPLAQAIVAAEDWRARLAAVRAYYEFVQPDLNRAKPWAWAYDPYEVDWPRVFTPIESALWCDIRSWGIPMYPQYPMEVLDEGRPRVFYADFANPLRRVAIECDGKDFHSDAAKDKRRDELLRRAGWTVYRFTGAECRSEEVERELLRIARLHLGDEEPLQARPKINRGGFE